MSYGLIYTIPFASHRNEACVVEIEKEDYTGDPMELTGADTPFEVDIEDDDFLYIPTRFSTARIRVVGSDYLQSLYSTAYQQYRVTFKREGVVTWCGFVKPEVYTQDYSSDKFELEIECMSAMSVLEFINYKQSCEDGKVFVSLWDLLKKCVDSSRGQYSAVYIPHVYARDKRHYDLDSEPFDVMTVSEQNFFDEDDKPMKLKEVLEEICKLLNWTCVDWRGELYFVDVDHSGNYHCYDRLPNWNAYLTVGQEEVLNVQQVGFNGADHSLDYLSGYNKAIVKTSNYHVYKSSDMKDFSDLTVAVKPPDIAKGQTVTHKILYLPGEYSTYQYLANGNDVTPVTSEYVEKHKAEADRFLGAFPAEICRYEVNGDGVPSINNYNYDEVIHVRTQNTQAIPGQPNPFMKMLDSPVFSLKFPLAPYYDGAFVLSGSFMVSEHHLLPYKSGQHGTNMNNWTTKMRLRVGDLFFNGASFVTKESTFDVTLVKDTGEWFSVKNNKTLDMPYNGANGYLIVVPKLMVGDVEMTVYGTGLATKNEIYGVTPLTYGFFMKNFKLEYVNKDNTKASDGSSNNSDRYYENIVNEDYINELDEIEFKISSYNNDGACYSKVLLDGNYLTDNLYSAIVDKTVRPEEHLIQRIVNHYSAPRIKLTQVIKETPELTPLTKLSDNFMVGKIFMPAGGSIDYKMGQFKCVMVEV